MPGTKPSLLLQPRDRRLLRLLPGLRVIDREQAKVVGPFGSTARANARLLALTQAGHLARVFVGTINGGRKALYFLPTDRRRLGGRHGFLARSERYEHQLAVNWIRFSFTNLSAVTWIDFSEPISPVHRIIPDGCVRLGTPQGQLIMFVEVDRGTETLTVIEQKAAAYLALAGSGECARRFGQARFRVLMIAPSERRIASMRRRIARVTDRLFWFAPNLSVTNGGAWSSVWLRPTGDHPMPLLEHLCDTAERAADSPPVDQSSAANAERPMMPNTVQGSTAIPGGLEYAQLADHGT